MSKNMLHYRGYTAKLYFSIEDDVMYGKVEGIRDVISFEFERPSEAMTKFKEAIDDYIDFCNEVGEIPDAPSDDSMRYFELSVPAFEGESVTYQTTINNHWNNYADDAYVREDAA